MIGILPMAGPFCPPALFAALTLRGADGPVQERQPDSPENARRPTLNEFLTKVALGYGPRRVSE